VVAAASSVLSGDQASAWAVENVPRRPAIGSPLALTTTTPPVTMQASALPSGDHASAFGENRSAGSVAV